LTDDRKTNSRRRTRGSRGGGIGKARIENDLNLKINKEVADIKTVEQLDDEIKT